MAVELLGFGPEGWGYPLLMGAIVTICVAISGFSFGSFVGITVAYAKIRGGPVARFLASAFTTLVRGIPDLLVIYIVYFGGSQLLSHISGQVGGSGFIDVPPFVAGTVALGLISGSFQSEVFRGAYYAIDKGEIEAATSMAMGKVTMFFRIIVPQGLRNAIPGLTNVCLVTTKETALISVVGLNEILRQANIAAGATYQPFVFFTAAMLLFLIITSLISYISSLLEVRYGIGVRRG